jgi:hypothetical protein
MKQFSRTDFVFGALSVIAVICFLLKAIYDGHKINNLHAKEYPTVAIGDCLSGTVDDLYEYDQHVRRTYLSVSLVLNSKKISIVASADGRRSGDIVLHQLEVGDSLVKEANSDTVWIIKQNSDLRIRCIIIHD